MDEEVTLQESSFTISRRGMIGLLVGSAVLPLMLEPDKAAASATASVAQGRPAAESTVLSDALRRLEKPDLSFTEVAKIAGSHHRVTFYEATWTGGRTYVRDIEVKTDSGWVAATDPEHRFDEQWIVFTSDKAADPYLYYSSAQPQWIAFTSIRKLSPRVVELRAAREGEFDLVVRWDLSGSQPELHHVLTAKHVGHYIVGYQAHDIVQFEAIEEVLCGALQHARVVGTPAALGAWELFAPMALTQRTVSDRTMTFGVRVPADVIEFAHDRELGPNGQPFGMSLRNDDGGIQPVVYAPQAGKKSLFAAGERRGYAFGLVVAPKALYDAYVDVCRSDFELTAYRENVSDTSLTATAHNILRLVNVEPDGDDSENFIPSFSGWWNRAKGFVDVENDKAVRTAVTGVLLSAQYLLSTPDQADWTYDHRSRPMLEYHVSRRNQGFTPIVGNDVYGNATITSWGLGGVSGDASTLVPLYRQTHRSNAGLFELAMVNVLNPPIRDTRTPMNTPLQAYRLTGDDAWLAEAVARAKHYIRTQVDVPYTTNQPEVGFAFDYSKAWLELFVLYEMTSDEELLAAAHREAKRFITQVTVRKVPNGLVRVPFGAHIDDQYDDWEPSALPAYPRTDFPDEKVPAWKVSNSGLTFEQLTTYKNKSDENPAGGYVLNPAWAPAMLRLGAAVKDSFLTDVAHNMVIGRFTNYPGYYNRQFTAWNQRPDFPMEGPPGLSCIYFHHAPAQLGLALDYLFSEHEVRSQGKVRFPREFECNFVYLKFSTYGHAPGTFYGEDGVWPYMPEGSIKLSDPQINWLTAVGNDSLYISLTNASKLPRPVVITFDSGLTGIKKTKTYRAEVILENGSRRSAHVIAGRLVTAVSARGITAVVVRGAGIPAPWHRDPEGFDRSRTSWASDTVDASPTGLVRGMLLMRPSANGADAYIHAASTDPAILTYAVDDQAEQTISDKPYPNEWTIALPSTSSRIRYHVQTTTGTSPERELFFSPVLTGQVGADTLAGRIEVTPTASPGDELHVTVRLRTQREWDTVAVTLEAPAGWTVNAAGDNPTDLAADHAGAWAFTVTVPDTATPADAILRGTVRAEEETYSLEDATVKVMEPIRILSVIATPKFVHPGDSVTLAVHVLNRGPIAAQQSAILAINPGWLPNSGTIEFDLPARGELEKTITLTSLPTIAPGTRSYFSARIGENGTRVADSVLVRDPNTIEITNNDSYPTFERNGTWLVSGLVGPDGLSTLYSPENETGMAAIWRPDLPAESQYEVSIWYPANAQTSRSAVFIVHHADGEEVFTIDEQVNPSTWNVLGTYRFVAGTSGYVRIEVRNADGYTRLAGARFRRIA